MFTKMLSCKVNKVSERKKKNKVPFWYRQLFLFCVLVMMLSSGSPQVRLHPHDLLLLLPDDGAQAGQQGGLVAPRVRSHAVIQTRQLVQQRLLAL